MNMEQVMEQVMAGPWKRISEPQERDAFFVSQHFRVLLVRAICYGLRNLGYLGRCRVQLVGKRRGITSSGQAARQVGRLLVTRAACVSLQNRSLKYDDSNTRRRRDGPNPFVYKKKVLLQRKLNEPSISHPSDQAKA